MSSQSKQSGCSNILGGGFTFEEGNYSMRRFLAPVLLLAGLGLTQENYTTNWTGHRTLHVNTLANSRTATSITANVVKYPMLVRLGQADSAIFAAAKTDGADVRFTKSNNTTRLQHAIETWDATNRVGAVWVLLDTVYANSQTQNFRLHWGNSGALDSSKMTAVFDTANGFLAVWHMNGATNNLTDATVNAFNGTAVGNANSNNPQITSVTGMIGKGHDFPASTNNDNTGGAYRITGTRTGALNFPDSGTYTLSAWAYPHSANEFRTVIGKGDNSWAMHSNSGTWEYFQYASIGTGGAWQAVSLGGSAAVNNWHNIVGIRKGASSYLYLNGVLVDSTYTNATNNAARIDTADVHIGKWGGAAGTAQTSNDRFFDGILDEIRISKVVRSADWNALDFGSQNAAQTLLTDSVAPVIRYAADSIVAEVGFSILNQLPNILTGVPQPSVSISPALPAGLSLTTTNNANRGLISGTPTAAQARTMHIITATNDKGTFTDTIYVTVVANAENYTAWTNTKTLNFTSPAATTIAQYPFLLRLNAMDSAVFTGAGTNGANLRFSRTDAIKLKYSIEQWDAVNRRAAIWVLMDQVTAGANTLRMHWGNGTATSQSNSSAVFSRTNGHVGVWHMGDASGAAARPNAVQPGVNDAVPGGSATASMVPVTGVIGMADTLRAQGAVSATKATDDHFYLGNGIRFANYQMSMSMWVNLPVTIPDGWNHWMGFGNIAGSDNVWFGRVGSNNNWKARGAANGAESNSDGSLVVTNGLNPRPNWAYFALTRSGTNGRRWTMHKDGVQLIDFTGTASNHDLLTTVRDSNFIGRALWGDPTMRGAVDEARVDNVARPAAWFQLDYATQRPGAAPVANLTYAALKGAPGAAITPAAPSVTGAPLSYTLTGTLPAGIVFNDTTGVISGTPTGPGSTTVTVTANSGVWNTSTTVSMSFGAVDGAYATAWSGHKFVGMSTLGSTPNVNTLKLPILVRLGTADSAIFNASQANGADIRFTKIGDVTRLKHEIEQWDKANKRAAVWVLLDTVYGNSTGSRFRIHYGNATVADSSKSSAVFDSANGFASVFHMGGTNNTNARPNAVAGGTAATPSNLTTDAVKTGVIGLADSLGVGGTNGTGSYLSFGPVPVGTITTGKATLSAWIKKTAWAAAWRHAISIGSGAPNNNFWFGTTGEELGALRVRTAQGTSEQTAINASGVWVDETWQHIQVAYEPTGTNSVVYANGVSVATGDIGHVLGNVDRTSAYIGRALWGDDKFTGVFDEVRLQKTTRSADWVKLEYLNQNPASTMVSFTDAQVQPVTGINNASASRLGGPALGFKAMGQGLLFQVNSQASSKVRIAIVDMFGRTVWSRTAQTGAGSNQIIWDGNASNGMAIGSGIFIVRMNLLDVNGKSAASLTRKVPLTH